MEIMEVASPNAEAEAPAARPAIQTPDAYAGSPSLTPAATPRHAAPHRGAVSLIHPVYPPPLGQNAPDFDSPVSPSRCSKPTALPAIAVIAACFPAWTLPSRPANGCRSKAPTAPARPACCASWPGWPRRRGHLEWEGRPVAEARDEFHARLLYLGHAPAIKDDLSALENLQIAAAVAGRPLDEATALAALRRIGLAGREDLPSRVLSQGQKRRVALARLLCSQARLWILDEPFVALDVAAVDQLCSILDEHLARGGLLLFTSHQAVHLAGSGGSLRLGR
jgi:heme exporter protein A